MSVIKQRTMNERFALLEDRVFKLELRLGPEPVATVTPTPSINARAQVLPPPLPARVDPLAVVATVVTSPTPTAAIRLAYSTPAISVAPVQGKFERTIGLKWAGWLGAILVVIGTAFGVKYAYSQHWFGQVPPAMWLSVIFLAGLSLIGVGEVIYRRVHTIPAASIFGAGIATLFLAGYVGHAYYELYSPGTALFLMAAAALVGALVARRGNLVSIAVLSHIGANVAPLLVGSRSAPLESFLIYLLALQMVALSLASWGQGKKWWTLRGLSLATTGLWIVGTCLRPGHEPLLAIFAVIYAVLYHAELIHSTMRQRDDASPDAAGSDAVTFSLLVTASLTLVVLWASRLLPADTRGEILIVMAVASAFVGAGLLHGVANVTAAIRNISIAHRIAAAALVALTVPVLFSGLQTDFAWALLAIAFATVGAKTKSPIARIAGIATWVLAVAHVAIGTYLPVELGGHHAAVWFSLFGTEITYDDGLAFALSVAGQLVAAVSGGRDTKTDPLSMAVSAMASALWVIVSLVALPPLAATAWIVEYAWLLVAADAVVPQLRFSTQAGALISIATIKWAFVDTLADRLSPSWSPQMYRPIFNPMMGIGALLSASIVTLYGIRRKAIWPTFKHDSNAGLVVVLGIAVAILTFGFSFEIDRVFEMMCAAGSLRWPLWQAKQLAWTIAWCLPIAAGFAVMCWRDPEVHLNHWWPRLLPLTLGLLALKYLTVDTLLWRALGSPADVTVLANLECSAGAVVLASLVMLFTLGSPSSAQDEQVIFRRVAGLLASLILLWIGTIEIDRYFAAAGAINGPVRPEQVALSIFWSTFAVACVLLGFRIRAAALRYFGLALLAVTLLKVVLIDMNQVQAGYRILSFIALGGLLMGTSVLYGKLGPRLLRDDHESDESQVSIG